MGKANRTEATEKLATVVTYDAEPVREFALWAKNAHPARAQELGELIAGYIAEQEAAAAKKTAELAAAAEAEAGA